MNYGPKVKAFCATHNIELEDESGLWETNTLSVSPHLQDTLFGPVDTTLLSLTSLWAPVSVKTMRGNQSGKTSPWASKTAPSPIARCVPASSMTNRRTLCLTRSLRNTLPPSGLLKATSSSLALASRWPSPNQKEQD